MRTKLTHVDRHDIEQLFGEIERYLVAVDTFRREAEPSTATTNGCGRL